MTSIGNTDPIKKPPYISPSPTSSSRITNDPVDGVAHSIIGVAPTPSVKNRGMGFHRITKVGQSRPIMGFHKILAPPAEQTKKINVLRTLGTKSSSLVQRSNTVGTTRIAPASHAAASSNGASSSDDDGIQELNDYVQGQLNITQELLKGSIAPKHAEGMDPKRIQSKIEDAKQQSPIPGGLVIKGVCAPPFMEMEEGATVLNRDSIDFANLFHITLNDGSLATVGYAFDGSKNAKPLGTRERGQDDFKKFEETVRNAFSQLSPDELTSERVNQIFVQIGKIVEFSDHVPGNGVYTLITPTTTFIMPHVDGGVVLKLPNQKEPSIFYDYGGGMNKSIVSIPTVPGATVALFTDGVCDACESWVTNRLLEKMNPDEAFVRQVKDDLAGQGQVRTLDTTLLEIAYNAVFAQPKLRDKCLELKELSEKIKAKTNEIPRWESLKQAGYTKIEAARTVLREQKEILKSTAKHKVLLRKTLSKDIKEREAAIQIAEDTLKDKYPLGDLNLLKEDLKALQERSLELKREITEEVSKAIPLCPDFNQIEKNSNQFMKLEGIARMVMFEIGFKALFSDGDLTPESLVSIAVKQGNRDDICAATYVVPEQRYSGPASSNG